MRVGRSGPRDHADRLMLGKGKNSSGPRIAIDRITNMKTVPKTVRKAAATAGKRAGVAGQAVVERMLAFYDSIKDGAAHRAPHADEGLAHAHAHAHALIPILPDQFIYAVDHHRQEIFMANGFDRVLGYGNDEVSLGMTYGIIHPDDQEAVTTLARRAWEALFATEEPVVPMEGVWSMDYRMRKSNGEYIKVLRQTCVLSVDKRSRRVGWWVCICKDITNIKDSNEVGWQYSGPNAEMMRLNDVLDGLDNVFYRPSARELDVLAKLAEGKSSRRIAQELCISPHTVNSHRKHLLAHTGVRNTAGLIALAVERGWV